MTRVHTLFGSVPASVEDEARAPGPKKPKDNSIFALANALQAGDKKSLWLGLMRELGKGSAPEAVHGLLFWGAKQMVIKGVGTRVAQGKVLASELAVLPHEARRRGEELSYALERFALSR